VSEIFSRRRLLSGVYILTVAVGALLLATLLHLPHGPEHWSADLRTAHLSKQLATQHPRIALVYVTDETLERVPYAAPTDRQLLADLIRSIDAAGPKAIGLDFVLDRPTEPAKDDALLTAIRGAHAPIVLGAIDGGAPTTRADRFEDDFFGKAKRPVGHFFFGDHHQVLVISDNVVRTTASPTFRPEGRKSFAEVLADAASVHPTPPGSDYIAWLQPPKDGSETFLTLSADTILDNGTAAAKLPLADLLKDKIVLIGGNFFDRDQHLTPFSVVTEHRYPGVFIHAQILAQLLDGRSLGVLSEFWQFVLIALAACLGFWSGRRVGEQFLFVELASVAALILLGILAFSYLDLIFPYTGVLLAWLASASGGHYSRRVHG
jgi:adenylate cyclase